MCSPVYVHLCVLTCVGSPVCSPVCAHLCMLSICSPVCVCSPVYAHVCAQLFVFTCMCSPVCVLTCACSCVCSCVCSAVCAHLCFTFTFLCRHYHLVTACLHIQHCFEAYPLIHCGLHSAWVTLSCCVTVLYIFCLLSLSIWDITQAVELLR